MTISQVATSLMCNFPSGKFPKVWPSEAPQAPMGPEHCEGRGAEAPWSPQKWPPSLRICRTTSRPRKTGLPAPVTSSRLPPFCLHAPHFGFNKKIFGFYYLFGLFIPSLALLPGWARGPSAEARTEWRPSAAARIDLGSWRLGSCHLGNYPSEISTWEKFFGTVSNILFKGDKGAMPCILNSWNSL